MKVFIVDDSTIIVERLKYLLSEIEGLDFTGQGQSEGEAVISFLQLKPDGLDLT